MQIMSQTDEAILSLLDKITKLNANTYYKPGNEMKCFSYKI